MEKENNKKNERKREKGGEYEKKENKGKRERGRRNKNDE